MKFNCVEKVDVERTNAYMVGAGLESLSAEKGYANSGGRMFDEEAYTCTFGVMESIPSLTNPKISMLDEFNALNKTFYTYSKARLIDNEANILESSFFTR